MGLWDAWRRRSSGAGPNPHDRDQPEHAPAAEPTHELPVEPSVEPSVDPTASSRGHTAAPDRAFSPDGSTDPDGSAGSGPVASPGGGGPRRPVARGPVPATGVRPVSPTRLAESMNRQGYRFLRDEEGNLSGLWGYRFFSFYVVRNNVLQVRGRWTRRATIERLWELLAFTDEWNRRRSYPKCYVRVHDDGRVHVVTEVAVPVSSGLDDAQLDHVVGVGIAAGTAVFDELDRRYPDPVLAAANA